MCGLNVPSSEAEPQAVRIKAVAKEALLAWPEPTLAAFLLTFRVVAVLPVCREAQGEQAAFLAAVQAPLHVLGFREEILRRPLACD